MKKKIAAIVLIAGLTIATAASANWGRGGNGNGGGRGGCPPMQGQMMQNLDPATQAKVTQFFKDNQALHKQIAMKRAEKQALMSSDKPDPQAAAKVAGEMFDLRTALQAKAEAAGVSQYIGPMGGRMGCDGPRFGGGRFGRSGMVDKDPAPDAPQQ